MDSAPVLGELELETPVDASAENDGEDALLSSLLAGSREAAEALVEETYRQVYASLFRLCGGDEALASDLTQETYRKAWASLGGFERRSRFSTWLYRIAYHTFLNHRRGGNRTTSLDEASAFDLPDVRPSPEQQLSEREVRERLRRAVLGLPEELRFTLTARFWGELPVREIARTEGLSEVAIRKRLRKALAAVRGSLDEGTDS